VYTAVAPAAALAERSVKRQSRSVFTLLTFAIEQLETKSNSRQECESEADAAVGDPTVPSNTCESNGPPSPTTPNLDDSDVIKESGMPEHLRLDAERGLRILWFALFDKNVDRRMAAHAELRVGGLPRPRHSWAPRQTVLEQWGHFKCPVSGCSYKRTTHPSGFKVSASVSAFPVRKNFAEDLSHFSYMQKRI
jgi:hypothetical protein